MNILEGIVVSTKTKQAILVEVVRKTPHKLYKKLIKREKKYKVDPKEFTVQVGDRVRIVETLPLSKDKHFKIAEVIKK